MMCTQLTNWAVKYIANGHLHFDKPHPLAD